MHAPTDRPARWAKVIDHTRCIGCHACTVACKSENDVPVSVTRTYVKYVDVGRFPHARRAFQVTRCNQCDDPPCVTACPTGAMFRRPNGIVDFAKSVCIGCKACIAACPYDAIFINPQDHAAEKCNFCAHRLDAGLEPACVVVCPTEAILVGDLDDPASKVSRTVQREAVTVRRPDKRTAPKLFYVGAHQATLDPLAAKRPGGGLFLWSEQGRTPERPIVSGHPGQPNNSAAALLSYDVSHEAPWGWRVSAYTWTKGIASGAYLVTAALVLLGVLDDASPLWRWTAPILSAVFLALTGALLVWDLKHPERFLLIFVRPQWQSWLVRGAFVILAYSALLAAHVLAAALQVNPAPGLAVAGGALAALTAVYTGFLFAQARARDLWQSPLLPASLLVQAALAGAAAVVPLALWQAPEAAGTLLRTVALSAVAHLVFALAEAFVEHPTAHARLAAWEMRRGRFAGYFWTGVVAVAAAALAPWLGAVVVPVALAGVALHEHAYVQAGQAVPLA